MSHTHTAVCMRNRGHIHMHWRLGRETMQTRKLAMHIHIQSAPVQMQKGAVWAINTLAPQSKPASQGQAGTQGAHLHGPGCHSPHSMGPRGKHTHMAPPSSTQRFQLVLWLRLHHCSLHAAPLLQLVSTMPRRRHALLSARWSDSPGTARPPRSNPTRGDRLPQ